MTGPEPDPPPCTCPEHLDATAQQERRARYEQALGSVHGANSGLVARVNAVLEVADAEQADLKAEVDEAHLRIAAIRARWASARDEIERLKAEATWAQLRAETGAEKAAADAENATFWTPETDLQQVFTNAQLVAAMTRTTCENDCGNCNVCRLSSALEYEKFMRRGDVKHIDGCLKAALRKVKAVEAERDDARAEVGDLRAECSETFRQGMLGMREAQQAHLDALHERDEARATIGRVKALHRPGTTSSSRHWCQSCTQSWPCTTLITLGAPTEPAPDLSRDAPSPTEDGYGLWLSTPMEDPPPVDPLAAAKARIEAAMRGMAT